MTAPHHARDTALQAFLAPLGAWLDMPGVTDICINRPGEVMLEHHSQWIRFAAPDLTFAHLQALARALATYTGQHVDEQQPLLSATLPSRLGPHGEVLSGARVQVVGPPVVAADTLALCIRMPSTRNTTLQSLGQGELPHWANQQPGRDPVAGIAGHVGLARSEVQEHVETLRTPGIFSRPLRDHSRLDPVDEELLSLKRSHRIEEFLRLGVRNRRTIVVAGRTGSGKTTLMRALIEEVPTTERLITIEDAAELFMPAHLNSLHLFYSRGDQGAAKVTASTLLEACLRLKPDRILLAEMRGEEAFSFLRLAASGHPGSLTSVHAGSAELAFDQIALMARQSSAGEGLTLPELQSLARCVVDIVVHMDIDARGRYVSGIYFDPASRLRSVSSTPELVA